MSVTQKLRGAMQAGKLRLARRLFPYGAVRRVVRGPLRGMRYTVAPGMGATYALGHSAYGVEAWSRRIHEGMVVYDVGGNCGQSALMFACFVGQRGQVYSFEPWPEQFRHIVQNVALNELGDRLRPFQCAVAAASGHAAFLCDASLPTQGKLSAVEPTYFLANANKITVETISIDELVADPRNRPPDVMKIDVEGAAAEVLRGAQKTLRQHRPKVYIELHGPEEQAGVRDWLQTAGYRLHREDGSVVLDPVSGWASPLWCLPPPPLEARGDPSSAR